MGERFVRNDGDGLWGDWMVRSDVSVRKSE